MIKTFKVNVDTSSVKKYGALILEINQEQQITKISQIGFEFKEGASDSPVFAYPSSVNVLTIDPRGVETYEDCAIAVGSQQLALAEAIVRGQLIAEKSPLKDDPKVRNFLDGMNTFAGYAMKSIDEISAYIREKFIKPSEPVDPSSSESAAKKAESKKEKK